MNMKKMQSALLGLWLLVPTAASCGFPQLPELPRDEPGDGGAASPSISLELLAGDIGGPGNADGTGSVARFNGPRSVVVDGVGNIYVADTSNETIRRITPTGAVTTLAGTANMA